METSDVVEFFNFIFLYVYNRHCNGSRTEMANLLEGSKGDVAGWLKQMDDGGTSYVATGKAMLLCIRNGWSVDEILDAYKANAKVYKYASCPSLVDASERLHIMVKRMKSAVGIEADARRELAALAEPLLGFVMHTFCGNDSEPGACRRKLDALTKQRICSFDDCPCNILCTALERISSFMLD